MFIEGDRPRLFRVHHPRRKPQTPARINWPRFTRHNRELGIT